MNHAAHGYWENSGHSVHRYDCLVGVCLVLNFSLPGTDTLAVLLSLCLCWKPWDVCMWGRLSGDRGRVFEAAVRQVTSAWRVAGIRACA